MNAHTSDPDAPTPRPKFDALFADPRHFRTDCRLLRMASRRGWLHGVSEADRAALIARFEQACSQQDAENPEGRSIRAMLGEAGVRVELARADQSQVIRALRYSWGDEPNDRTSAKGGRPRERWHVADYPNRIDAQEIRRRAKASGLDLSALRSIHVLSADNPADDGCKGGERIALAVVADARYGWRVWLKCPRCNCRRVHLYPTRAGVLCRGCAGINYANQDRVD